MVVGAFPAAKLGVLLLKQISKPIANVIKSNAKKSQLFRQYVCMPPAQFYNWCEVQAKMWSLNLGKPVNVPQLNEAMAIELGANLLGEVIIFVIGAGILIVEYVRQSKKEAIKEESMQNEKLQLALTLNELAFRLEKSDTQLREMTRLLADLESRSWLPKKPKIIDDAIKLTEHLGDNEVHDHGNNYPNKGLVFKALNFIDNELFLRQGNHNSNIGIVTNAIMYLENDRLLQ